MDNRSETDNIVNINMRGTVFRTYSDKFRIFPNSKLATLSKSDSNYEERSNQFFFDRNPSLFHFILDIYDDGELHIPKYLCSKVMVKELQFWNLDKDLIGDCCINTYYNDRGSTSIYAHIKGLAKENYIIPCQRASNRVQEGALTAETKAINNNKSEIRQHIWKMIQDPMSSTPAKVKTNTRDNQACKFNVQWCKMIGRRVQVISNLVAYLSRGFIISERLHTFECVHVICALKHKFYD